MSWPRSLPPLTGFSPGAPLARAGVQTIDLQGAGFRPGYNGIATYNGLTLPGQAPVGIRTTGGPLYNVNTEGSRASLDVDFAGIPGPWAFRVIDPGNLPGDDPHSPIASPWFDFATIGPALALAPGYVNIVNPDGSTGVGRAGPAPLSYSDVVDLAATAAQGVTVLRSNYVFAPGGAIVLRSASGNLGVDSGGSPPIGGQAVTGPGPGGGIAPSGVSNIPTAVAARLAQQPATVAPGSPWLWIAVALGAYFVWRGVR